MYTAYLHSKFIPQTEENNSDNVHINSGKHKYKMESCSI